MRVDIIGRARIKYVGKSQSCMVYSILARQLHLGRIRLRAALRVLDRRHTRFQHRRLHRHRPGVAGRDASLRGLRPSHHAVHVPHTP
eukprot:COSAG05_NODE_2048_length_3640_cov_5.415619_8_plen_87_part_00